MEELVIGATVYVLDKSSSYFYLRKGKISEKIISSKGIRYNVEINISEKLIDLSENVLLSKEDAINKLRWW